MIKLPYIKSDVIVASHVLNQKFASCQVLKYLNFCNEQWVYQEKQYLLIDLNLSANSWG